MTVPAGVKARIDLWTAAGQIREGRLFRPVTKAGVVQGRGILDEKAIWRLVVRYARETELGKRSRHMISGGPAPGSAGRPVETWNRSSCCLGMLQS